MRVMIIDGGGRGQALAAKLAPECEQLFVSPGNPGNEELAYSTGIETTSIDEQLRFATHNKIDVTIAANDDPLALGIVDEFGANNLTIFGPTKAQARIEWDKNYAKKIGRRLTIPMGAYSYFTDKKAALDYAKMETREWPLFLKNNGLALGKGVVRCNTIEEFEQAAYGLKEVVVEDYVPGPEASLHSFCDGRTELTIPMLARDHKTLGAEDTGPMTGGMGTVAPLPNYTSAEVRELGERFAAPIVRELGFKGLLFSGLKGINGVDNSIEWNARPGDPEIQVFLRLMNSELLPVIMACIEGSLDKLRHPMWHHDKSAVCLALAAPGYPVKTQKGAVIEGLDAAGLVEGVQMLQAATKRIGPKLTTNGGRVLNAVSFADTLETAVKQAYKAANLITFNGQPPVMRSDIGLTCWRL